MIDIEETRNKLKQFGVRVRLKGNDFDKRRVLAAKCVKIGIEPVFTSLVDVKGRVLEKTRPII